MPRAPCNRIIELLNAAELDLRDRIERRLAQIKERGIDVGLSTIRRFLELERHLRDLLEKPHRQIQEEVTKFLVAAAEREPFFVKELMEGA